MSVSSRPFLLFSSLVISLVLVFSWYNEAINYDVGPVTSTKVRAAHQKQVTPPAKLIEFRVKEEKILVPEGERRKELEQQPLPPSAKKNENLSCASKLSLGFGCIRAGNLTNRHLQFLHITKTGGSTIEDIALEAGIKWGFRNRDYLYKFTLRGRAFKSPCIDQQWHWPLHFFKKKPYKRLRRTDLFTIVRNPYTRIISEYRWEAGMYRFFKSEARNIGWLAPYFKLIEDEENASSPDVFNNYIQKRLKWDKNPCTHYRRQSSYIFAEKQKNEILIDNILRFEDLQNQFNYLMKAYNLNLTLHAEYRHQEAKVDFHFTVDDLWNSTKQVIYNYYQGDFKLFGYEK